MDSSSIKFLNNYHYDNAVINSVIEQDIYNFKTWAPFRSPKFIVDIGSHLGSFSFLAATMYPRAQIISYELIKEYYETSLKNLQAFPNTSVFNKSVIGFQKPEGVWKADNIYGSRLLFKEGYGIVRTDSLEQISGGCFEKVKLDCTNFEEIFRDFDIDYIDYLKVNCEGGEYEIFAFLHRTGLIDKILFLAAELHGPVQDQEVLKTFLKNNFSKCEYKEDRNIFLCSKN